MEPRDTRTPRDRDPAARWVDLFRPKPPVIDLKGAIRPVPPDELSLNDN
jgi:hypothetical protein